MINCVNPTREYHMIKDEHKACIENRSNIGCSVLILDEFSFRNQGALAPGITVSFISGRPDTWK